MVTWPTSKRGDFPSLMHLAFGDLGNFSFLSFCFPESKMRVILLFWQVMIDGLHKNKYYFINYSNPYKIKPFMKMKIT